MVVGAEGELEDFSRFDTDKGNYISGEYPPVNMTLKGSFIFYEIDGIIKLLDEVSQIYSGFYEMIPGDDEDVLKESSLNTLRFFGKVRAFVNSFVAIRIKLSKTINFIVSRLTTLRTGQLEMLKYFDLSNQFLLLQKKAAPFESRDPQFRVYLSILARSLEAYNIFVEQVLQKAFNLKKISSFFENEIVEMKKKDSSNNQLFVIDKFNDVLMFVVNSLGMKKEVLTSVDNIKQQLIRSKSDRRKFVDLMQQIDKRIEVDKTLDEVSLRNQKVEFNFSFSQRTSVCGLIFGIWVLIFSN